MKTQTPVERATLPTASPPPSASEGALQDVAQKIVCDAHRSPREYIRRANTQQQGE
ncbi:hypothetical protein Poly24_04180 [Rosistilla carotiformis]|uniref:Uncharacterized protein n=1 Tax=Rosistilla carotiformis TaxID=2528017 RepID=A0A518JME2_9BACT|nr:hypothetical protein Poly24_04180 [Rosistilla carotiformis]